MARTVTFDSFVATHNALQALELSRALTFAEAAAPSPLLLHGLLVEVLQILGEMAKEQGLTLTVQTLHSIAAGCHGDVRRVAGAIARQRFLASAAS